MVFVTPRNAAYFIGSYSQILTLHHPGELRNAGLFLCKLVEDEIESTRSARESELAKKFFPEEFPLPLPPENLLAAEYFYGSCLAAITETDSSKKSELGVLGNKMEQQISEQILHRPRINEICTAALRSANVHYLIAAGHFLYPQLHTKKDPEAAIKFYNRQARIRYQQLEKLFKIFSVPEITSKHLQFLKDINETKKGSAPKDIRQKVKELKRKEPELTADLVKAERAQYRGMFHIIYGLKGFIPLSRKMYHQALPTLKQERNNLEKEIFTDYLIGKTHALQHQEVLLGLMRCYALQGNYKGIMKTADKLQKVESAYQITAVLTASAQRIELEAQQNKKYFGKCLPFVSRAPESVVQMMESFISSYERPQNKLFWRSIYGTQEIGRKIDFTVLKAA